MNQTVVASLMRASPKVTKSTMSKRCHWAMAGRRRAQAAPWPADGAQRQRCGGAARKSSAAASRVAVHSVAMNGARSVGVQSRCLLQWFLTAFILMVTVITTRSIKIIMISDQKQQRRGCLASSVRAALREQPCPADGAQKQRRGRATCLLPQCRQLWKQSAQKQRRGRPTARNSSAVARLIALLL